MAMRDLPISRANINSKGEKPVIACRCLYKQIVGRVLLCPINRGVVDTVELLYHAIGVWFVRGAMDMFFMEELSSHCLSGFLVVSQNGRRD